MNVKKLIATNIKSARVRNGMSQSELAKKMSLSVVTMNRIENGHVSASTEKIKQIADILGLKFLDLCKGVDEK